MAIIYPGYGNYKHGQEVDVYCYGDKKHLSNGHKLTLIGIGSFAAMLWALIHFGLADNIDVPETKDKTLYSNEKNTSSDNIINDNYEPVVDYKIFYEGEHTIAKVTTKDNIKDVDGYSMIDISIIEDDKVIVTYVNAVPVNCMGIDGEYNTFGTIEENNKQKTK